MHTKNKYKTRFVFVRDKIVMHGLPAVGDKRPGSSDSPVQGYETGTSVPSVTRGKSTYADVVKLVAQKTADRISNIHSRAHSLETVPLI